MRALLMRMGHELLEDMGERVFAKEDAPRQTLLLHRAHPAFGVSIQIWRPRRQWHPCDPSCVDELLKGRTIFPVSVMEEVRPGAKKPHSSMVTFRAIWTIQRSSAGEYP
jgi:hypothetical protein